MASLDDLLAGFGHAVLGQPLKLDGSGVCTLGFHEGRSLTLEPEPGTDKVHLYATLARLPGRDGETIYGKLLTANLFGKATGEAWFAINPLEEAIVLNRVLLTDRLDVEAFGEIVTAFMDTVEHWARELDGPEFAELEGEDEAPPREAPAPSTGEPLMIIRG